MLEGGKNFFTYSVSYVGQWKHKETGAHIREFWTHVPGQNGLLAEIAAINGNIFLSVHLDYEEDDVYKEFWVCGITCINPSPQCAYKPYNDKLGDYLTVYLEMHDSRHREESFRNRMKMYYSRLKELNL